MNHNYNKDSKKSCSQKTNKQKKLFPSVKAVYTREEP